MTAPNCAPQNQAFWLGVAGGAWVTFVPDTGHTGTLDEGRIVHPLLSGGVAVQRQTKTRRSYVLTFTSRTADVADAIVSIAYGLLGVGPYCFVDPTWRNVLPGHIAACGSLRQNSTGFIPSGSGTVVFSSAVLPPTQAPLSGVQVWVAPSAGTLGIGQTATATNDTKTQPPPLPGTAVTFGAYLKSAGATTITVTAQCCNSLGVSTGTVSLGTWACTTSWTRFAATLASVSVPAGTATVSLTIASSAATTVNLAALDAQYITASIGTLASSLPAWVHGLGVPRVLISAPQNSSMGGRTHYRTHDLTLTEVA